MTESTMEDRQRDGKNRSLVPPSKTKFGLTPGVNKPVGSVYFLPRRRERLWLHWDSRFPLFPPKTQPGCPQSARSASPSPAPPSDKIKQNGSDRHQLCFFLTLECSRRSHHVWPLNITVFLLSWLLFPSSAASPPVHVVQQFIMQLSED